MHLFYDTYESPVGKLFIAASSKGLCAIYLDKQDGLIRLKRDFKEATYEHNPAKVKLYGKQLRDFFSGKNKNFGVPLDIHGTEFQKKVWKILQSIPYGSTISYGELARKAGIPRAARAAGTACGSNPVPFVVPCHRVIAGNGTLGGFGLGLPIKKYLLKLENADSQLLTSVA